MHKAFYPFILLMILFLSVFQTVITIYFRFIEKIEFQKYYMNIRTASQRSLYAIYSLTFILKDVGLYIYLYLNLLQNHFHLVRLFDMQMIFKIKNQSYFALYHNLFNFIVFERLLISHCQPFVSLIKENILPRKNLQKKVYKKLTLF